MIGKKCAGCGRMHYLSGLDIALISYVFGLVTVLVVVMVANYELLVLVLLVIMLLILLCFR